MRAPDFGETPLSDSERRLGQRLGLIAHDDYIERRAAFEVLRAFE